MIADYDDDTHFCLKCHITILGLDNYVNHRKAGCSKNLGDPPKSPLPSQLLPPDESFGLKADDFFFNLELRSSSKKASDPSTSGKNFGILTRSKTTAVIQATSGVNKDQGDIQQSKSGKNVWIGGHQLKELGYGDNQSKLIKAVANLERRKEEPARLNVYEEFDEDSEDYDYDDDSSDEDQDAPPRHYTGGKWKPTSPIQWSRNSDTRDWNEPPPSYTGGKWKPPAKRSDIPPPTFTGSKWVSPKKQDVQDIPPPTHTKGKWKPRTETEDDFPPPNHTKGKWKPKYQIDEESNTSSQGKGKLKPKNFQEDDFPPPSHTKGKWKPKTDIEEDIPSPSYTKGKWKPKNDTEDEIPPPTYTRGKWRPKTDSEDVPSPSYTKGKWKPKNDTEDEIPPPTYTKGKWRPKTDSEDIPSTSYTKGKWKPKIDTEDDIPPPTYTKGKWKPKSDNDNFPPPGHTKGKWKPKIDNEEDIPGPSYTKGKWKPKSDSDEVPSPPKSKSKPKINHPPPSHTKGKWNPKSGGDETQFNIKTKQNETKTVVEQGNKKEMFIKTKQKSSKPSFNLTKGKWIPSSQNKTPSKMSGECALRKSGETMEYWCSPCGRRLASKVVYERHLKSELHFKRTLQDREFDDNDDLNARRAKIKPPESIFNNQEKSDTTSKKRKRKKIFIRCEVCQSKVSKYLIGKHLISHYHCRKGDITTPAARSMVLENIYGVVLECPFQCSICKFYCNTHDDFLRHWLSREHVDKKAPGYFYCNMCKFRSDDTHLMYTHLLSPEHNEVISVINRSVPIVIKKINPIHCLTCKKEFTLNMQLLNHCKRFNHDDSVVKTFRNEFICEPCGEGFFSNIALQRHHQNVHKEKYFVCTACNLKFENIEEAKLHRRSLQHKYSSMGRNEADKGNLRKKCEYCQETFANFLLLKGHLKEKHPEHKIRCPHCGANFTITQELTSHLRSKSCKFEDNPQNTLRCEKCPFSSNSTSELIFHLALHNDPLITYPDKTDELKAKPTYRYKCPVCSKIFPKSSLHAHIRLHTQERPFVCKICNASFARKNNLQFHVKNHDKKVVTKIVKEDSGERPFLCSTCGANFKKKSILQQHMQIHTGKLCKCPKFGCVYTARKLSEIKEHFKIHSDVKSFVCDVCDYKGKTKQQLNRHMTVHDSIKKYHCPKCPFTARTSTHLRRHARLHTGAKPFSCPYCTYKCNNLENLRKHVLSTNKHPGKCIYECKFCSQDHFQSNFAKDFKAHLVTRHPEMFGDGAEAATYVAGIYEVQNDSTYLSDIEMEQEGEGTIDSQTSKIDETTEIILNSDSEDSIVSQISPVPSSDHVTKSPALDQMLPMFIIPKDETVIVENSPEAWNLVGRYDVEEESGTLIPFQSDTVGLFQDHFD